MGSEQERVSTRKSSRFVRIAKSVLVELFLLSGLVEGHLALASGSCNGHARSGVFALLDERIADNIDSGVACRL